MVWLHLVDHLDDLRDPAALPGWLATTTRRQCIRVRRAAAQLPQVTGPLVDADNMADTKAVLAEHELLLAERHAALRKAVSDLPPGYRELIILLTADPPVSYAEISAKLGIPIGSIGPSRSRCLARLRRHPAIAELIDADTWPVACEGVRDMRRGASAWSPEWDRRGGSPISWMRPLHRRRDSGDWPDGETIVRSGRRN